MGCLVYTFLDTFYFLADLGAVWWTQVQMTLCPRSHGTGVSNISWQIFLAGLRAVWGTHIKIHFVSLLTWKIQHMLKYILPSLSFWDIFYFLPCMGAQVKINFISSPASRRIGMLNSSWDKFCVHARMARNWSTHVEIHLVSLLAWKGFGQLKLIHFVSHDWYVSTHV